MTPFAKLGELRKEAARGDQLLKAVSRNFSNTHSGISELDRFKALQRFAPDLGQHNGGLDAVEGLVSGSAPRDAGTLLRLLTGKATKNTDHKYLQELLGESIGSQSPIHAGARGGLKHFAESVPGAVKGGLTQRA
jgi:hypothetical protein